MNNIFAMKFVLVVFALLASSNALAADSYRWLHVTIDTPWAIFIFLLPMVLIPVILMAILYWRFAGKSNADAEQDTATPEAEKNNS